MAETVPEVSSPAPATTADSLPTAESSAGLILSGILTLATAVTLSFWIPNDLIPAGIALAVSALLGWILVPRLRAWKTGQVIRQEGPQTHLKKAGTPTMGGIIFIPSGILVALMATGWDPQVLAICLLTLGCAAVGWLDDLAVIRRQSNQGISPKQKLGLLVLFGALFCGWMAWTGIPTALSLPGLGSLDLHWLFWPLALFVLVGTTNAVNLTDGMDGLAAGVVALVCLGLGLTTGVPALTVLALVMGASCLGFLAHNRNPARVFMGDTGSLGLGGVLAGLALVGDQLWALALMGSLLIVETLSVMVQVSYFKYTKRRFGEGRRLLKMSPLHHHLELSGWSEIQTVGSFYAVTALLVMLGYGLSSYWR